MCTIVYCHPVYPLEQKLFKAIKYRKILKISPRAYIFQRHFLRGLYSEGLIYAGKFAFSKLINGLSL